MNRTHFRIMLHGVGIIGSTEYEALSMPYKRIDHHRLDLIFVPCSTVNFTQMNRINSIVTSFVAMMAKKPENNYFIVQQF